MGNVDTVKQTFLEFELEFIVEHLHCLFGITGMNTEADAVF